MSQENSLEPDWCCPICSDGLEGEANGWLVRICTEAQGDDRPGKANMFSKLLKRKDQCLNLYESVKKALRKR